MHNDPDAVALLRELRPPADYEPDVARLERILAVPPPARRPRRRGRMAVAGAVAAVAAAVVVALSPFVRGSTDVVARAAAALNDPGSILHFKAREGDRTLEVWQTAGARQERILYEDGLEFVEDWDTKTSMAYSPERDEVIRHTEPDLFDPAHRVPPGLDSPVVGHATNLTDDLAQLFERAGRGEDGITLIGETTIRDIAVYELRIDFTVDVVIHPTAVNPKAGRNAVAEPVQTMPVPVSRTVYIDRERFLPVRVVEQTPKGPPMVTEFLMAERLPRTPENERLLRMAPHPGAERVVEGRL
jgi:hypothetical protein